MAKDVPLAAMDKIIRDTGALRISESAKEELRALVIAHCETIAERAVRLARHAGRRTVQEADIELALEQSRNL